MVKTTLALILAFVLLPMLTGCPGGKLPKDPPMVPMVPTPKAAPSTALP